MLSKSLVAAAFADFATEVAFGTLPAATDFDFVDVYADMTNLVPSIGTRVQFYLKGTTSGQTTTLKTYGPFQPMAGGVRIGQIEAQPGVTYSLTAAIVAGPVPPETISAGLVGFDEIINSAIDSQSGSTPLVFNTEVVLADLTATHTRWNFRVGLLAAPYPATTFRFYAVVSSGGVTIEALIKETTYNNPSRSERFQVFSLENIGTDRVRVTAIGKNVSATGASATVASWALIGSDQNVSGTAVTLGLPDQTYVMNHAGTAAIWVDAIPVRNAVSLEQFGAVGDGVTNDTAAWVAALATGKAILLGSNRTYLVNAGSGTVQAGGAIYGLGDSSVLKITGNGNAILVGGDGVTLANFRVLGNGVGGNQIGIADADLSGALGYQQVRILNVTFDTLGGEGILINNAGGAGFHQGALVLGCRIIGCGSYGAWIVGEYVKFVDCEVYQNAIGGRIQAGNIIFTNNVVTDNTTYGAQLVGGGNDGHGIIANCDINHNGNGTAGTANLYVFNGLANGMPIVGCNFYAGRITLVSSNAVRFLGCAIDADAYDFDGSLNTVFENCLFPSAYANTVNNNANAHNSSTLWINPRKLDGTLPTFITYGSLRDALHNVSPSAGIVRQYRTLGIGNDEWVASGTAAAAGGTAVFDFPIPTDTAAKLIAEIVLLLKAGGHVTAMATISAEYAVRNNNGALAAAATPLTGSANPLTSTLKVAATVEATDAAFGDAASPPTATWSIAGTNARLTVTNGAAAASIAEVSASVQATLGM